MSASVDTTKIHDTSYELGKLTATLVVVKALAPERRARERESFMVML